MVGGVGQPIGQKTAKGFPKKVSFLWKRNHKSITFFCLKEGKKGRMGNSPFLRSFHQISGFFSFERGKRVRVGKSVRTNDKPFVSLPPPVPPPPVHQDLLFEIATLGIWEIAGSLSKESCCVDSLKEKMKQQGGKRKGNTVMIAGIFLSHLWRWSQFPLCGDISETGQ